MPLALGRANGQRTECPEKEMRALLVIGPRIVPIYCIVPPQILREIGQRGDPKQRAQALEALAISERVRGRREAIAAFALATPAGEKRRTIYDAASGEDLPGRLVRGEGDKPTGDQAA